MQSSALLSRRLCVVGGTAALTVALSDRLLPAVTLAAQKGRRPAGTAATPDAQGFEELDQRRTLYVGMLTTWLAMLAQGLDSVKNALGDSSSEEAAFNLLRGFGTLTTLHDDARIFDAPDPFRVSHRHLVDALDNLSRSGDLFVTGLMSNSQRTLDRATGLVEDAADDIDLFHETLPFRLPDRTIVED